MNHYTIYTKEKIDDKILHPNHIYAADVTEAIEVLAASDNCKREFVSDIDPQQRQCYTYVNLKSFGKESGYLLTDAMKFKINHDIVLRSCPDDVGGNIAVCDDGHFDCGGCWEAMLRRI